MGATFTPRGGAEGAARRVWPCAQRAPEVMRRLSHSARLRHTCNRALIHGWKGCLMFRADVPGGPQPLL